MASGVHRCAPVCLSIGKSGEDALEAKKSWPNRKITGMMVNSPCTYSSKSTLLMLIQNKILTLRDILDLPPLNGVMMIELLMGTVEDLHSVCPDFVPCRPYEVDKISLFQGLCLLYEALKFVGTTWEKKCKQAGKFQFEEVDLEKITSEKLGERVVQMLDQAATQAREFLDLMEEEDQVETITPQHQQGLEHCNVDSRMSLDVCGSPPSPHSPTSVLPEITPRPLDLAEFAKTPCSPPLLWPLRLQAMGKLKPIDVKRLSFHASPQLVSIDNVSSLQETCRTPTDVCLQIVEGKYSSDAPLMSGRQPAPDNSSASKTAHQAQLVKPDSQEKTGNLGYSHRHDASADATLPLWPSKLAPNTPPVPKEVPAAPSPDPQPPQKPVQVPVQIKASPPPPPPPAAAKGSEQLPKLVEAPQAKGSPPPPPPPPTKGSELPTQPTLSSSGPVPPPPPPVGVNKALRAKKSTTKLKRSTHMGNLYRILKGKVEGSILQRQPSEGRRNQIGSGSGAGKAQGMADALAEMTKRSAYFRQIEEDVEKYGSSIMAIKSAITSFQSSDMNELIKFQQHVELNLESLIDETQVLARFQGFPFKKLESIRMAATLYSRLESIATNLQNWKMAGSVSPILDKVESYFNKIKEEVDAVERSKEEESKRFLGHNIQFDFNILTRIKELMVDLSSSCMEIVLKEGRNERSAASGGATSKSNGHGKMLWRAFQLAFRVYNFAGGQDDRADKLTKELAHEIQTCPEN